MARVRRRAPSLSFEVTADPWYVEGDSPALERALTNLLDNAAKWSPPSGTVTVALHDGVVTVDDEGSGIDDEDLPHIFERFYRSDVSRAMPGSGLGLSIVAQVAERHAGTVEAGRSPSGGTRLTFRLPGAATPEAGRAARNRAAPGEDERLSRQPRLGVTARRRSGPARNARTAAARRAARRAGGSRWVPTSRGRTRGRAAGSGAAGSTSPRASRCRRRW